MKIKTRLALTLSIIASAFFLAFGITVYWLSSNHQKHEFQIRLEERVNITEKIFLEKESFSPAELKKITNQFLHSLPEETEEVVEIKPNKEPSFKYNYPKSVQEELVSNKNLYFEVNDFQGISKIFRVKGKNYLVIVTAIDKVALQNLVFLRNIILLLTVFSIPLIFVGSFAITKRMLLPISKKIEKANTISASNIHQRLKVYNANDELGKLAIAFNNLLNRLEASFESQKAFIRRASHEIRNPVTAIMGEAEITISKSRTSKEYIRSLSTILSEAETLSSSVNNLLELSKVDALDGNIKFEKISFNKLLLEIEESFEFINPLHKIKLHIPIQAKNESIAIMGNRNLLKIAIINLFDNACKFSENKEVNVSLIHEKYRLKLVIIDQGIGILPKDQNKIMEPFYRGNNAMKIKGSGIGLALCSKIIKLHYGRMNIKSEVNLGTEVYIFLPLKDSLSEILI